MYQQMMMMMNTTKTTTMTPMVTTTTTKTTRTLTETTVTWSTQEKASMDSRRGFGEKESNVADRRRFRNNKKKTKIKVESLELKEKNSDRRPDGATH